MGRKERKGKKSKTGRNEETRKVEGKSESG